MFCNNFSSHTQNVNPFICYHLPQHDIILVCANKYCASFNGAVYVSTNNVIYKP